jgi:serine phosphatase RsbU (regulator of sigma subunit)
VKKRFNIVYKLIIGFGIIVIALLINSIITYKTLSNNRKIINNIANNYVISLTYLQELSDLVIDSKLLIKTWVYIDKKADTQDKIRLQELHEVRFPNSRDTLKNLYVNWSKEEQIKLDNILITISDTLFEQQKYVMSQLSTFDSYNDPMIFFEISFLIEEDQGETMLLIKKINEQLDELISIHEGKVATAKVEMTNSLIRFQHIIIITAILFLTFIIIIAFALARVIVRPILQLKKATEELSEGNLDVQVSIKSKDEIELLGEAFNHMAINLKTSRDNLTNANIKLEAEHKKLQIANNKITASIHYAKYIQNAILPPTELINNILHENFIFFRPKDIVSGDFYWVQQIEHLAFVAAVDCTGHGVPGAFMSMLAYAFLNEIVGKSDDSNIANILNQLRVQVKQSLRHDIENHLTKDGMDIALCVINNQNKTLQFSGAYRPLYLVRNNELIEVKADKMPIGLHISEKASFTQHQLQLFDNDMIYIFSDGYYDQFGGPDGRKFLTKKFKEMLLEINEKSISEQKQIVEERFDNWKGDSIQIDDVLVIGIRI